MIRHPGSLRYRFLRRLIFSGAIGRTGCARWQAEMIMRAERPATTRIGKKEHVVEQYTPRK
jgi:hypothetical protein